MPRLRGPILLAAALGLVACGESSGPQEQAAATQPAPFSAMALLPSEPEVEPEELLGLSADDVTARLGHPTLIRREKDAEVWQYRQTECVLDLFLYGSVKHVEHVDLRDRGDATDAAVRACFQRMLREREKKDRPEST